MIESRRPIRNPLAPNTRVQELCSPTKLTKIPKKTCTFILIFFPMKEAVRTVMWVACSAGDALDNCKKALEPRSRRVRAGLFGMSTAPNRGRQTAERLQRALTDNKTGRCGCLWRVCMDLRCTNAILAGWVDESKKKCKMDSTPRYFRVLTPSHMQRTIRMHTVHSTYTQSRHQALWL